MDDGWAHTVHVVNCQARLIEHPQGLLGPEGGGVHNTHQWATHTQLCLNEELVAAMHCLGPRHSDTVHKANNVGMAV